MAAASDNPFTNELNSNAPLSSIELSNTAPNSAPSLRYAAKSVNEAVLELSTDITNGLNNAQDISVRRATHGLNELSNDEDESLILKFFQTFYEDPLILLLIGSAAISFYMGNVDDAISITLAIFIVVTVGFVQEYRSEKSLEALNKLVPAEAHLTRNGQTETILASNLVPGDIVHFSTGDRIPADVRLYEAVHLTVDESNLTGENSPVHKTTDQLTLEEANSITDRTCIAFMGTLVREGHGSGIVVGTGHHTAFGQVFEMMSSIEKPKTPLQQAMDKLGKDLSVFSFGVIGVICLIGVIQGKAWLDMFQISVSLAVAAIPEGLPIIVTVTLALGVLRMAKQKAIVKRLPSVETLGSVNVICSDKTGTLTQNHMTASKIWTINMNDEFVHVRKGETATPGKDVHAVLEVGNICNNARYSTEKEKFVGNPTDIALLEVLPHFSMEDIRGTKQRVYELPFSSLKKYMAVCVHQGDASKSETYVKGATERILEKCDYFLDEKGVVKPLTGPLKEKALKMADKLAEGGLRILAFAKNNKAFKQGDELSGLTFIGLVGMSDPPRPAVAGSVSRLIRSGVHVIMITGDSETTAINIAKQIGMPVQDPSRAVLTGEVIDSMSEDHLADAIQYVSVFARTTPEHKVSIVKALQRRGDIVAMTGDGVNDAPALKLADIGIAMGNMGTDVAKEAADMVLTDDDFSTILKAIKEGKGIFYNIQNFLTFQLSTSIAALSLIAISTLFNLPNPLNAMQILWINILMDGPPAQSLGVEPVDDEVMNKAPRSRQDKILTMKLIQRVLRSATCIVAGTIFCYVREMKDNVITARDTTMTFTCFVFFDMFNALSCRHHSKSVFKLGLTNHMFNLAVGCSILGQMAVIYVPFLQAIFQTEALQFNDLIFLLCIGSSVFWVDEAYKYYKRNHSVTMSVSNV